LIGKVSKKSAPVAESNIFSGLIKRLGF